MVSLDSRQPVANHLKQRSGCETDRLGVVQRFPVNFVCIPRDSTKGRGHRGGGVFPEKLGGVVWPASQNTYAIYDLTLFVASIVISSLVQTNVKLP